MKGLKARHIILAAYHREICLKGIFTDFIMPYQHRSTQKNTDQNREWGVRDFLSVLIGVIGVDRC